MNPLISIIIPVYNVELYLGRCLQSIVSQSYKNLEIIIVDDGSPDNCGKICDDWALKDDRIKVYHKENGGLSDARNYGVEKSRGEYITFVDSDDYIAPNYVEYLYKLITKYSADTSVCCMIKTETDVTEYCINNLIPQEQVLTGKEACRRLFDDLYMVLVTAWGKLYKREIVTKYPFPKGKKHEDEATTCKYYYESQNVVVGNQCLYAYYQNPKSITHTVGDKINLDSIWALEHRALFFEEKSENLLAKLAWNKLFYYCISDSMNYNWRCDKYLKHFANGKTLTKRVVFESKLYDFSHFLFKCYLKFGKMLKNIRKK